MSFFSFVPAGLSAGRLLLPCLLAYASIAAAEAPPAQPLLTLAEAQRVAVARSQEIAAQESVGFASREMAVAAGSLPDPVLRLGVDNLPVNGADRFSIGRDFMTMRRIGVMQEWTRADKRTARSDRFESEARKSDAEKANAVASVQRDTALAWLDRYYAEAQVRLVKDQLAQSALEIQAAEGGYRAGKSGRADLLAAKGALGMMQDRAADLDRMARNANTALVRWVGDAAAQRPLGERPDIEQVRTHAASLEASLQHHPEVAMLARQEEAAAADVRLAQAERKSDWTVEVAYSQRGAQYSDMVSVGVAIPLQLDHRNRQDRTLSAKLALADQARALKEEKIRMHLAELQAMLDEWRTDRERLRRYRTELIPLADERTEATITAYRGMKATLADVLASRRDGLELRSRALDLEASIARLWARIDYLVPADAMSLALPVSPSTGEKQ